MEKNLANIFELYGLIPTDHIYNIIKKYFVPLVFIEQTDEVKPFYVKLHWYRCLTCWQLKYISS